MNASHPAIEAYELRFQSLFDEGRGYFFPCDAQGHVDIDSLSERARNNYLYARTVIGREFAVPAVQPSALHVAAAVRLERLFERDGPRETPTVPRRGNLLGKQIINRLPAEV
jgi:hypothetical protein